MNNNFFKRLSDSFKEFGKKDAVICAAVAIVIVVLIINSYINNNEDKETFSEPTATISPENGATSELELKLENVLGKISGTGKVKVMITYESAPSGSEENSQVLSKPLGAVVIAEGAENLEVRIKIQQAVQTVLGIEARQVKIFEMSNN